MSEPAGAEAHIQLNFENPDNLPIVYASNAFVRFEEHAFIVTFAQVAGPTEVNPDVDELKKTGLPARIVARMVVQADDWDRILRVFADNYENWDRVHGPTSRRQADEGKEES
jgi:hypothetical protein